MLCGYAVSLFLLTNYGFDVTSPKDSNIIKSYPDIFFDEEYAEKFIEKKQS